MDELKVTLITSRFNRMLEEFAEIDPRIEFRDIVRGVAVRVVMGALRRTDMADPQRVRDDYQNREWTTLDGKRIKLSWHLHDDAKHGRVESHRKQVLDTKLGAIGLAKKSWLHQAQQLGGEINAPARVRAATYNGKDFPQNAAFTESGSGGDYALKIINSSPIVQAAGGQTALVYSMAAETRYFYTLLAKGGFDTAATRARRYPQVYVKPLAIA